MSLSKHPPVKLLVMDLDNTVWDWFQAWHASFTALLDGLSQATGIGRNELEKAIRPVHQARGTSEYSALLWELPILEPFLAGRSPSVALNEVIHAQNSARFHQTELYPGVMTTLEYIRAIGVPIVAYTESLSYWTEWRIKRVGLDGVLDVLYSSPDHDFPTGMKSDSLRTLPDSEYGLRKTKHLHVPRGIIKPNPAILQKIVDEQGVEKEAVIYVGDSRMKDVAMAQAVGVMDVHARYGEAFNRDGYEQLRRVSHWPDADVELEVSTEQPTPNYVLKSGFADLLDQFEFRRPA